MNPKTKDILSRWEADYRDTKQRAEAMKTIDRAVYERLEAIAATLFNCMADVRQSLP